MLRQRDGYGAPAHAGLGDRAPSWRALGLKWSDINWKERILIVERNLVCINGEYKFGKTKTKSGNRKLLLSISALLLYFSLYEWTTFSESRSGPDPECTVNFYVFFMFVLLSLTYSDNMIEYESRSSSTNIGCVCIYEAE